jgi:hypothetical protein
MPFSVTPDLIDDDYNKAIKFNFTNDFTMTATSPYFTTNLAGNKITTTIRIANISRGMENNAVSINEGDTLSIMYKTKSSQNWNIAKVYSEGTALTYDGNYATIETDLEGLTVNDTYQIRYYIHFVGNMLTAKNVYIKNTKIEPELPCKYAQNITVNEDLTTNAAITLDWEDINGGAGADFIYSIREKGAEEWSVYAVADENNGLRLTATGLNGYTTYELAVRAVCDEGDSSKTEIVEATTFRGTPHKQSFTGLTELPDGYRKATGLWKQESGKPTLNIGGDAWFADEPMGSGLLGISVVANNGWLLFPVIYLNSEPGNVTLNFEARAFYKQSGVIIAPVSDTCKAKLYIVAASTIDSLNGNHTIDTINIVDLDTAWLPMSVDLSAFTKHTQLAFFLVKDAKAFDVYLQIDSIDIDYRPVCPAVTNIQTSDLTATGVTISWEGEATEYGVSYKKEDAEEYATTFTESTTITLSDLEEETTYLYYITPYCGEDHTNPGLPSEEESFSTLSSSIEAVQQNVSNRFVVSSNAGRISILNPSAMKIDRVEVVGTNGAILQQKNVKTSSNVLLSAIKTTQVAIVKVISDGNEYSYKILVE